MEVVQKAVNEAMHAVRNSPLLRRRFGDRDEPEEDDEDISPEKDRTPFVQGFTYRLEYLGKSSVPEGQEQDHGCCDRAVDLVWGESKLHTHTYMPHPTVGLYTTLVERVNSVTLSSVCVCVCVVAELQ